VLVSDAKACEEQDIRQMNAKTNADRVGVDFSLREDASMTADQGFHRNQSRCIIRLFSPIKTTP